MAASPERLLQAQSLHLLHETILGERASPGAGLGALVARLGVVSFGIVEHIIVVDRVSPAGGTGPFLLGVVLGIHGAVVPSSGKYKDKIEQNRFEKGTTEGLGAWDLGRQCPERRLGCLPRIPQDRVGGTRRELCVQILLHETQAYLCQADMTVGIE